MTEKKELVYTKPKLKLGYGWGHCPGCHHPIVEKLVCEVLEDMGLAGRAIGVAGVGCSFGFFASINIDGANCAHGAAPAVATGIKHALYGKLLVFTIQGDGDCAAIGGGYVLNAAARAQAVIIMETSQAEPFENRVQPGGIAVVESTGLSEKIRRDDITTLYIPAVERAVALGNAQVMNLLLLGAYLEATRVLSPEAIDSVLESRLAGRGREQLLALNKRALREGMKAARDPA